MGRSCQAPIRLLPTFGPLHNRHATRHPDRDQESCWREVGVSDWILVDQARSRRSPTPQRIISSSMSIPAAAAQTPFGGTIAHGFLTLSLLCRMAAEAMLDPRRDQDGGQLRLREGPLPRPGPLGQARARPLHPRVRRGESAPANGDSSTSDRSRSRGRKSPLDADWIALCSQKYPPLFTLEGREKMACRDAVIVSTARTPIGKAYRGAFNITALAHARRVSPSAPRSSGRSRSRPRLTM